MCQQTARKYKTSLITVVLFAMSLSVAASEYMPLRFEENWGSNCNKMTPKCWRITEETTLTLGADARVRAQGYWPLDFGIGNTMNSHRGDSYTLFRGLMHGDLRVGKHAQMFMQFGPMMNLDAVGVQRAPIKAISTCSRVFWLGTAIDFPSVRADRK